MTTFREFVNSGVSAPPMTTPTANQSKPKKWKATKEEIVAFWKNLRPDSPIMMRPISYSHEGSTYGEDGLRITGSPQFIASTLARLKEFLTFESPATKLAVTYRQTESPSQAAMGQTKTSYVFYVAARERGNESEKPKI